MPNGSEALPNPYIGPRAFMAGEKLYGRSREANQLANLLTAERIILLYSPSGAGKTSLIQAALIPNLKQRRFWVLPIVRVNLDTAAYLADNQGCNRYVFSALLSLEEGLPPESQAPRNQLACMSLSEYLDQRPVFPVEKGSPLLIFDQFEEILTLNPTDQDAKREFFEQLGVALQRPDVWALFAMREEFIAALEPYLLPVPNRFKATFRLDLLNEEAASKAIQGPAEDLGVNFSSEAVKKLVDDLRRVQVQHPDGSLETQLGPYIEPVQLQVVCHRLWSSPRRDIYQITPEDIFSLGQVDQSLVDQSLAEYYAQRVADEHVAIERAIRTWFDQRLISESGVRGTVLKEPEQSGGLDNVIIARLVDSHLVRAEKRGGATWFELAHDRLVAPIRANNEAWFKQHLNLLQKRASQWVEEYRPESLLLAGQELTNAEGWARENRAALIPAEEEYLRASHSLKRRKMVISSLGLVVILLAVLAFLGYGSAIKNARVAQSANTQSALNLEIAQAANTQSAANLVSARFANTQSVQSLSTAQAAGTQAASNLAAALDARSRAATQAAIAQAASTQAIVESEKALLAQAEALRSLSYQLAAQGIARLNTQADIATLLGVEALAAEDTPAARELLLLSLERSQQQRITIEEISAERQIRSLAVSPDGNQYAYGLENGSVVLGNILERWRRQQPRIHNSSITSLAFSNQPMGSYLASGDFSGFVRLRDLQAEESRLFRFGSIDSPLPIHDLDFHPSHKWLAVGSARSVYLYDVDVIWDSTDIPLPELGRYYPNAGNVQSLAWSPDGNFLVVGDDQKYVQVWELGNTDAPFIKPVSPPHRGVVQAVAWSPSGDRYASTAIDYGDTQVIVWKFPAAPSGEPEWSFKLPGLNRSATSLSFSKDGRVLAIGNIEGKVFFWDTHTGQQIDEYLVEYSGPDEVNNNDIAEVAFLPSAGPNQLAAAQTGGKISILTLNIQQSLARELVKDLGGAILALSVHKDGSLLAAVQSDPDVEVFRIDPQGGRQALFSFQQPALSAAFSPDGHRLAMGLPDQGRVDLVSVESGLVEGQISLVDSAGTAAQFGVYSLAFSPDGQQLAGSLCQVETFIAGTCATGDGARLVVVNLEGEDLIQLPQESSLPALLSPVAFTPSGAIAASNGKGIFTWSNTREIPGESPELDAPVVSLVYSSDGSLLAAADAGGRLLLWSLSSASSSVTRPQPYPPLSGATGSIISLAFDESGTTLFMGLENGVIQRWDLRPETWVRLACLVVDSRDFTPEEWAEYFPGQEFHPTCSHLATASTSEP
jgi:WD40 repeat protein